jgi:hypothetical protein
MKPPKQKSPQYMLAIRNTSTNFILTTAEKFLPHLYITDWGCMSIIGSIISCINPTFACKPCCGNEEQEERRREELSRMIEEVPAEVVVRQRIKSDILPVASVKESRIFMFERDGTMIGYNQAVKESAPMISNIPGNIFESITDRKMSRTLRAVIEHCFRTGNPLQFRMHINTPESEQQYVCLLTSITLSVAAVPNGIAERKVLKWSLFCIYTKTFITPLTYLIWPVQTGGCKVCALCSAILIPADSLSAMKKLNIIPPQPAHYEHVEHTSGHILGEYALWENDADPWISPRQWRDGFETLVPEETRVVEYTLCATCEQDVVALLASFNIRQPNPSIVSQT